LIAERHQLVVGITGGIGSGKSRVTACLAEICGLPVISLDDICRELLDVGNPGWQALQHMDAIPFVSKGGGIDRAAFRSRLFADSALRRQVDDVLHPLARSTMAERIGALRTTVLVEIPLLFEAGWQDDVDLVVVVWADRQTRCERIVARDRVSMDEACRAVDAQQSLSEKARRAHRVIDNSGSWQQTRRRIERFAAELGCREDFST
jgi:dephospho-CoA kinase